MIGIFDSGSGGLSVFSALRARTQTADIVYFGDIANAPYGERTPEDLARLTTAGIELLKKHGATEIVSACNSVSQSVLLGAAGHERVIEMTRPLARMMRARAGAKILLLATPATIRSGIYTDALAHIVQLDTLPIPALAGAIEFEKPIEEIADIVHDALQERAGASYDAIILGCTHYPLVRETIAEEVEKFFGPVELIDPADAVAAEVCERFCITGEGTVRFIISKDSHAFRNRIAPYFLETQCSLEIV